jgi:hypothetical protein
MHCYLHLRPLRGRLLDLIVGHACTSRQHRPVPSELRLLPSPDGHRPRAELRSLVRMELVSLRFLLVALLFILLLFSYLLLFDM